MPNDANVLDTSFQLD